MTTIDTPCHVMGDIHARISHVDSFARQHPGQSLIILGDCGFGFDPLLPQMLNHIGSANNVHIYCIRGNHDDPAFFLKKRTDEHLHPLPDFSLLSINGKTALAIGGGISIDRLYRRENINWWKNEPLAIDKEKLASLTDAVDILLTHTGPAPPGIPRLSEQFPGLLKKDPALLDEIRQEQALCNDLAARLQPSWWIYAHFHQSITWKKGNILLKTLNVNEIINIEELTHTL